MTRKLIRTIAVMILAAAAPAGAAYSPVKIFTRSEGLPDNRVLCLFQDADGMIWAGTEAGAARYDGQRWQAYTVRDGLAGPRVYGVTQDREGSLWFGTSGGICRYNGLFWDRLGYLAGSSERTGPVSLHRDASGIVWMGTPKGLYRLDLERGDLARQDDAPLQEIEVLFPDREGRLWLAGAGAAALNDGRRWRSFGANDGLPAAAIRAGFQDPAGTVWLATAAGLVEYNGFTFKVSAGAAAGLPSDDVTAVTRDHRGKLWAGTARGPAFFDGYRWREPEDVVQWPDRKVTAMITDQGGNLWLGTDGGVVFLDNSWEKVAADGAAGEPRHPLLPTSKGVLWFALPEGAGTIKDRLFEAWGPREGLEGTVRCLAEDAAGHVWVGTDRGLHRFDGRRFLRHVTAEVRHRTVEVRPGFWKDETFRVMDQFQGLTDDRVNALLHDERDWLWVATDGGLSALAGEKWILFEGEAGPSGPVLSLAGRRTVWAGTAAGLWIKEGERWRREAGGPAGARINALLLEGDDHLWAGTDAGIWELRSGGWTHYGQEEGLLDDTVTSLIRDDTGLLWAGTPAGLSLYDGRIWSSVARKEGLPNLRVLGLASDRHDGLLVAGEDWLARYLPDRTPPQTYVKNAPTGPVGSPQCLFEFQGADLLTESFDLRFSWRLDGGEWSPFSREPLVTVSDLANGVHTFEVRAVDRGLNVDPTPSVTSFEVNTALFDVEAEAVDIRDIFAALYRHYASDFAPGESPVGDIVLRNKYDRPLKLKVSLLIPRFMDFSTDRIVNLPPGEKVSLPLRLELNDGILGLRENSVEQMLITLQYYIQGELKENKFSRGLTIYGRNAMLWDDPRRIALYVTHLDPDVEKLAKTLAVAGRRLERDLALDNNFIRAAVLFDGLGLMSVRYLPDPAHPYAGLAPSRRTLDFVRYPRETLAGKAGDCDDIAVLYASLLQAIGVDTALVDVQDHIFLMFDTGLKKGDYRLITPDRSRVHLDDAGRVWVPVETTLVGQPFLAAWEKGLAGMERRPRTIIDVRESWKIYQPVLGGAELPLPSPEPEATALLEAVTDDLYRAEDRLLDDSVSALRRRLANEPGNTAVINRLGILLGRKGYLGLAAGCFNEVIRLAPGFPGGWSNLANIHYEKGEFPKAVELYRRALKLDPSNAQVHVEIALTYAEMGDFEQARRHYLSAVELNPEVGGAAP